MGFVEPHPAGVGAVMFSRGTSAAVVRMDCARHSKQPCRFSRFGAILAAATPLPADRSQGSGRPAAGQPASVAGILRSASYAGRGLPCALEQSIMLILGRLPFAGGALLLCWTAVLAADSVPPRAPVWPDSFVARVEAMALLQTLNADLLSHDSATLTLERWCDVHRLASPPRIHADRVMGTDKSPTPEQRRELQVSPDEPLRYRRVRLRCGAVVLSEADNWYVPGRLTPDMNALLE